eukprot:9470622-Pyramimonas_sp.AAC.1
MRGRGLVSLKKAGGRDRRTWSVASPLSGKFACKGEPARMTPQPPSIAEVVTGYALGGPPAVPINTR